MGRTRRPRHGVTELRWIGRRPSHCVAEVFRAGRLCNRIAESVWQCDRTAVAEISAAIQTTWHGGPFRRWLAPLNHLQLLDDSLHKEELS